ncbi:ABC-F family ATP-binding cassette domain-containing protein [Hyphomonas johnsonii]|jgi:ATP-binding cassette subfamily F protein 3|uniref:ABC transporter n=1 Tax=Hyphomonas johnsonii MHS-2 TaxID=1280950 RepID=A0A059FUD7_9PROT|nr:ABC-F family ATP-binding cassette domain-containing protein [Hyphomonas johnsonii]KCZ94294.1 ABC transporter [Hyphomonas johnsonii MHS-2]
MLTISNLDYRVEARLLFEGASAQIASGWKVGLVGRNGTGKSTLLKLIREEIEHPTGDSAIRLNQGARLGWVAQEVAPTDETILDVVLAADAERHALMQEADTAEDPMRIADIHTRLVDIDAWSAESRAAEVLMGLGFTQKDLGRPTREFSGGWRMRAAIAGVLFSQPDLLLLDEPTNYLDLEGAAWLEGYLKKYPHTVLIVSHDREMLNRCVTHTMALEHRKLTIVPGGYDAWLRLRSAKYAQLESQRAKQEVDKAHLQAFVDRFRAKASKARQAQSRVKMLEKMQDISIPMAERTVPFHFPEPGDKMAPPLLELRGAELGYGEDASILRNVTLRLDPDDRIAIVGTNGQGKTTLVKSIAERLPLMAGDRVTHSKVRIGYFSQDQLDELTPGETVLDHVRHAMPKDAPVSKQRSTASQMGFSHEKVETKVEKLSGGEKVRLLLGLMAMDKPHILILDEPTSHLDIDSREALIYALNDFKGAVLLITHDIFLAEGTADQLWLVRDGRAETYDGDLQDYRALVLQADRNKSDSPAPQQKAARADQRQQSAESRKAASGLKRKADDAEKRLEKINARIAAIDVDLAQAGQSSEKVQELLRRRADFVAEAARTETVWIEALESYEAATTA